MNKNQIEFLLYQSAKEDVHVQTVVSRETIWLTQKSMAELFGVGVSAINKHLKNIFTEGELKEEATISKMEIVQMEGAREILRKVDFYNLDAIISVGYRVNSQRATQFRIWATGVLHNYMRKGFIINKERMEQGRDYFDRDYYRELLETVRSIRASERRVWQQITDIFAECSIDYDKNSTEAHDFYSMIQNKFHYAITHHTAAEMIYEKADHTKKNMGLTTWKHAPDGRILKSDALIAKNYLTTDEIKKLERTVSTFFDHVERIIEDEHAFTMNEFARTVDAFLAFQKYQVLEGKGNVSADVARAKASAEYDKFNKTQHIESDFDLFLKEMPDPYGK